jgi:hypothetical protein
MQEQFQARRISKRRADEVKKSGFLGRSLLINTFNGIIIIPKRQIMSYNRFGTWDPRQCCVRRASVWVWNPRPVIWPVHRPLFV